MEPTNNTPSPTIVAAKADLATAISSLSVGASFGLQLVDLARGVDFQRGTNVLLAHYANATADATSERSSLMPYFDFRTLSASQAVVNGVAVNFMKMLGLDDTSTLRPSYENTAFDASFYIPSNDVPYDPSRCFITACNEQGQPSVVQSAEGNAYGVKMSWTVKGTCWAAFSSEAMFVNYIRAFAQTLNYRAMRSEVELMRQIALRSARHKTTLTRGPNNTYLLNNNPLAPTPYGSYRNGEGAFDGVNDPQDLMPLDFAFLEQLGTYYSYSPGAMPQVPGVNGAAPVWGLIDPTTRLYNELVANNPNFNPMSRQLMETGNYIMPYMSAQNGAMVGNWKINHGRLFPFVALNSEGKLVFMEDTVPVSTLGEEARRMMHFTTANADTAVVNPALRHPYAAIYTAGVNEKMATVWGITEPYAVLEARDALGDVVPGDTNIMEFNRSIMGAGTRVKRRQDPNLPSNITQLAETYDHYFQREYIVRPNTMNEVSLTVARCRTIVPPVVSTCNLAAPIIQTGPTIIAPCGSTNSFNYRELSGPANGGGIFAILNNRSLGGNLWEAEVSPLSNDASIVAMFGESGLKEGDTFTVITADAYDLNQTPMQATMRRSMILRAAGGNIWSNAASVQFELSAALPAGHKLYALARNDQAPTGLKMIRGSAEVVRNAARAIIAGELYVRLEGIPTPAQWANGATKSLTRKDANGTIIGTAITVTYVELVNSDETNGPGLIHLRSASADFTKANLNNAASVEVV